MGLSSSKQKTSNAPWGPAQGPILHGLKESVRVFDAQQPQLEQFAGMQRDTYGKVAPGAEEGVLGAQGVVNANLRGDNLNGNPYISGMWDRIQQDTTNGVNSQFSRAGRYGSGNHAGILAKELDNAHNNLLFNNYAMERANQNTAVGQAQSLMGGSQSLLNNAAELPWLGVGALNGNVRQASNGYGTQTQTSSPAWGPMLAQSLAQGVSAYASGGGSFSDRRLKKDIVQIGTRIDGLGIYNWVYKNDPTNTVCTGYMADEVEQIHPAAFIKNYNGTDFAGVNYGAIPRDVGAAA